MFLCLLIQVILLFPLALSALLLSSASDKRGRETMIERGDDRERK